MEMLSIRMNYHLVEVIVFAGVHKLHEACLALIFERSALTGHIVIDDDRLLLLSLLQME